MMRLGHGHGAMRMGAWSARLHGWPRGHRGWPKGQRGWTRGIQLPWFVLPIFSKKMLNFEKDLEKKKTVKKMELYT